jgi:glutamyl-tRNA reductase
VSVVVVGLNQRTVSLPVLESLAVSRTRLPKALHQLSTSEDLTEVVVVSTCQRTEIYGFARRYHPAVLDIRNFMADWSGQPPEMFASDLYEYHEQAAVRHLFKVAAGLDSAVLGEGEILGQLGDAWEAARREGAAGPVLSILFRHAAEVGKRVRSETAIARGTTSLSQAAVALARSCLDSLEGLNTLVIGAGEMGEAMAQTLAGGLGSGQLLVANRTLSRAEELAERCGGRAIEWAGIDAGLADADVVLSSTGAPDVLLEAARVEAVMAARPDRPLLLVDLALPRDVDPACAALPGVTLLDMDAIAAFASAGMESRRLEVPHAQEIVAAEVARHADLVTERQVAPLVAALHERAESIRTAEIARYARRLGALDPSQQQAVEALTRAIVAKVLHDPTVNLKATAGSPSEDQLASALRQLFGL